MIGVNELTTKGIEIKRKLGGPLISEELLGTCSLILISKQFLMSLSGCMVRSGV
jgi:hypothetical protein